MLNLDHVKKYFARIAIGLVICASFSIVNAQSSTATAKGTAPAQVLVNQTTQIPTTELAVVRAQLEDNRKFQDQLLATVYWSLGTLATVAVLLTGFGWFANTKMYERDKAALERDLRAQLVELIRVSREASEANVITKFSDQESNIAIKIDMLIEKASQNLKKTTDGLENKLSSRITANSTNLDSLTRNVHRLEIKNELLKRESWQSNKIYRNVLQATVSALVLAIKLDDDHEVGDILDLLGQDMDAAVTFKAKPIDNFLITQIVKALESVKGDHAYAATTLKSKVDSLVSG